MRNEDLTYGLKLTGKNGEEFEILDIPEVRFRGNTLIRFTETGNYQMANITRIPGGVIDCGKPFLYGVGYVSSTKDNPAKTNNSDSYYRWRNMLERCYGGNNKNYVGVTVCEEWHDYTAFEKWEKSVPHGQDPYWALDKDLFNDEEKVYSPQTCVFLPKSINFILSNKKYLLEHNFDLKHAVSVIKLNALLLKYKQDLEKRTYLYIRNLIKSYEEDYQKTFGISLSKAYRPKIKKQHADLKQEACVCLIHYKNEMFKFDNLHQLKEWFTKTAKALDEAPGVRDVYFYNNKKI